MDDIWERTVETALDGQTDVASVRTLTLDEAVKLEYLVEAGLESPRDLDLSNNWIQDINDLRLLAKLKLISLDLIIDVGEDEESDKDEEETETETSRGGGGANEFSRPSSHRHSNDVEEDEEEEGEEDEDNDLVEVIDDDNGDDEDVVESSLRQLFGKK
ncbi:hypothetical protein RJ640_018438, partial [Escallonia rubra]